MKAAFKILGLLLFLGVINLHFRPLLAAEDSLSIQTDEFSMAEGETKTFNFLDNDFIFNKDSVTIQLLDSAGSNITYSGNGSFEISVPIDKDAFYNPLFYRFFRYKVTAISDTLNTQTANVTIAVQVDKRNHRNLRKAIYLNTELVAEPIPLPNDTDFNLINYDTKIINHTSNNGKTRIGNFGLNVISDNKTLPFLNYSPNGISGYDTLVITTHETVKDVWDTTNFIITVIPITYENDKLTRWFFKNDPSGLDTTANTLTSSDSIVSLCDGSFSGSSIYGTYNVNKGVFTYRATFLQAGKDSICLRNVSGNSTYVYFITVIDDIIRLRGTVFNDTDENCHYDTLIDPFISTNGLGICAVNDKNETYFGNILRDGTYTLSVPDTGKYAIRFSNNPYNIYNISCNTDFLLTTQDFGTIVPFNLGLNSPYATCAFPVVKISTSPNFRRCRSNTFTVQYGNLGGVALVNPYIDISVEEMEIMNVSDERGNSIAFSSLGNGLYRIPLSNIDPGMMHSLGFSAIVLCDSTANGQTLCTEAHIYPDAICSNYEGAIVEAFANCLGDSVQFRLNNRGANMKTPGKLIVIQDDVMIYQRQYQLPNNGTLSEKIKTLPGRTYRIVAEREADFPEILGDLYTTAAIENCEPVKDTFSTGFINQFPLFDGEPFRSLSCNEIIGSYDPNDKIAFPIGYADEHFIEANTAINYQINFQNTGNDTAFQVVLVDTIAAELDPSSIIPLVASHAYRMERIDSHVVKFVFENILLPDSNRNEPASNGFVKFIIKQKKDLAIGTKIYNKADIYFDFNAPIRTNETVHTIGKDFLKINLLTDIKNPAMKVKGVKVYPNPFRTQTQIIVESEPLNNARLLLTDMQGRIITVMSATSSNAFELQRQQLASGMYFFSIVQENVVVASGKLVVE